MKRMFAALLVLMMMSSAYAQEREFPVSAWLTREVPTFSRPEAGTEDGGLIAESGHVRWLSTHEGWALVDAQGNKCYVPADALTTDRVFRFDRQMTRNMQWPYKGELHISPEGAVQITICMADDAAFDEGELLWFEVMDEQSMCLVCRAELIPGSEPKTYTGEGMYTGGSSLLVRPVIGHSGYSVEIQW